MLKKLTLVLGAALLGGLGASAAFGAAPFGHVGGIAGGDNAGSGVVSIIGWALDDDGVKRVVIKVDGDPVGTADYGRASSAVFAERYSGYPDAEQARWAFLLNTAPFENGVHIVSAVVISKSGESRELDGVALQFFNTVQTLGPIGVIEAPRANADLFGTCQPPEVEPRRYTVVSGYAVDPGLTAFDTGVKWVQLLINGTIILDTKTDCFYDEDLGGLTNCYGLEHRRSARLLPSFAETPNAGFRFLLDVGYLVYLGYTEGHHTISVRVGDVGDTVNEIQQINADFFCDDRLGNSGSFGALGKPRRGQIVSGIYDFTGWALDWEGVDFVSLRVDGVEIGTTPLSQARPSVTAAYPGFLDSARPGFRLPYDSNELSNGEHKLQLVVQDLTGARTQIGTWTFYVIN